MDLIPAFTLFNVLASIPLVMVLVSIAKPFIESLLANPIARAAFNTTLVVLESTKLVWRPALNLAVMLIKNIYKALVLVMPQIKAMILNIMNTTAIIVQKIQAMGLSISQAVTTTLDRMGEFGDAIIVVARGITKALFYAVRLLGSLVGAFESVFGFAKKMIFEPSNLTFNDMYNVLLPFFIVTCCIAFLLWIKRAPASPKYVPVYEPRRSSRIARKRAILLANDVSESLPACKETPATPANL